ncbi:MAG: HEAT repeat domain-containing protein [Gemmatimonadota bacterium]|nr:HEAT repeat domain-containing protein [Gemmatimonadota bacterium]
MTEVPEQNAAEDLGAEWDIVDLPVAEVHELFVILGKALRAHQLYDDNNPVRQRFTESLRQAFRKLWQELDHLTLHIEEDRILLETEVVYANDNRSESLAFLFFKDGVREITFLQGIETQELDKFLAVLQKARKLSPEGDDLLTVLWDEDLINFRYQYIDYLSEGVDLPEAGSGNSEMEMQQVLEGELSEEGEEDAQAQAAGAAEPAPASVRQEDFNPTLYSLDPREKEIIAGEMEKETNRDLRKDVLAALFDRLEEPHLPERQSEILGILHQLLPNFLSRGALVGAIMVLKELRVLEATQGILDAHGVKEAQEILDEASSAETIRELIQALYDGTVRATPQQLSAFLQFLRPGAIAPLLRASEMVDHRELQAVIRKSVQGIAGRYRSAVVKLLDEEDPVVAAGAARLAGQMGIVEAGPGLARLLSHDDPAVRLAAVESAAVLKASTAAGALRDTLDDPVRDIRVAAARALGTLRYQPAAATLADIVTGKEIRDADITEKVAFFEAYGLVGGEAAVSTLDRLLNGKGFLGRKEHSEVRAAAALALGKVHSNSSRAALEEAVADEDPVVRSSVSRALREEEGSDA